MTVYPYHKFWGLYCVDYDPPDVTVINRKYNLKPLNENK